MEFMEGHKAFKVFYLHEKSSGCAGFAHDPAKVEDQVQFLARA